MPLEAAGITFRERPGNRGFRPPILHTHPHGELVEPWPRALAGDLVVRQAHHGVLRAWPVPSNEPSPALSWALPPTPCLWLPPPQPSPQGGGCWSVPVATLRPRRELSSAPSPLWGGLGRGCHTLRARGPELDSRVRGNDTVVYREACALGRPLHQPMAGPPPPRKGRERIPRGPVSPKPPAPPAPPPR